MMIGIIVAGCENNKKTELVTSKLEKNNLFSKESNPLDFGNGVWYYKIKGCETQLSITSQDVFKEFGPAISNFIASHKELKISSLAPNVKGGQQTNDIVGYWIITEPRNLCPCDTVKK
ncbi:MAG: hypothetical protein ACD_80C00080G0001 [uncultured bacterium (gcode 4)]|uniref:Uncharacterized protein n=1 Tax=uncultured bacterium (gcode 4) TaxID=1234023 RepID=K1XYA8_9BACT|nr:MAG: hypothetical protein ACD_80C00080G0001 [uncultured bacterium (gcode 4)]